ncbi:hypothetical protein XENOCAPTIV_015376, partial [Xenoophorus captivus]
AARGRCTTIAAYNQRSTSSRQDKQERTSSLRDTPTQSHPCPATGCGLLTFFWESKKKIPTQNKSPARAFSSCRHGSGTFCVKEERRNGTFRILLLLQWISRKRQPA